MKTRILTLLVALASSAAFAIAADTQAGGTNDSAAKAACCQSQACAHADGDKCSCKKNNEECCATATGQKAGKAKKDAKDGCCQSQACGKSSSAGNASSGKCSCKKGGHACKTAPAK